MGSLGGADGAAAARAAGARGIRAAARGVHAAALRREDVVKARKYRNSGTAMVGLSGLLLPTAIAIPLLAVGARKVAEGKRRSPPLGPPWAPAEQHEQTSPSLAAGYCFETASRN